MPAQFAPLSIEVLGHQLSSNPGRHDQVVAIPLFETKGSIHGATSLRGPSVLGDGRERLSLLTRTRNPRSASSIAQRSSHDVIPAHFNSSIL